MELLREMIIMLGLAVLVVLLFNRFRLPVILGFLLTGLIAGPTGLHLVADEEGIHLLSEIGVVLLLFVIGLEFSPKDFLAMRRTVLLGGGVQVGLSIVLTLAIALLAGLSMEEGIFLGFCISLSSTAIVLRVLQDKQQITSPHGRNALGILIFQDIIIVPMMLLTPILAGQGGAVGTAVLWLLGKMAGVGLLLYLIAQFILPRLLDEVAKAKSRELFVLTTVLICFSVAGLTYSLGLSLALGAFLAGLLLADSDYSHQATGNIIPFREVFTSFFFISIGMLLDLRFFIQHLHFILPLALLVALMKILAAGGAAWLLKYPLRTTLLTGFALFQVGEFAFVLVGVGQSYFLLDEVLSQYFLSVSILTMAATSWVMSKSAVWADWFAGKAMPNALKRSGNTDSIKAEVEAKALRDHLIVIGFGLNGTNVARAAEESGIPYVVLDMNADRVKEEKRKGVPIVFGDAQDPFILEHLHVYSARVAVVAISDPQATRKIVASIRSICRTVFVIVRTRFVKEIDELMRLGADEVIPEEYETSIEIFTRVLNRYLVPEDDIDQFTEAFRSRNYQMLRPVSSHRARTNSSLNLPELRITCLRIHHTVKGLTGLSLAESALRQRFGINLMALQRGEEILTDIGPQTVVEVDDLLYVLGKPDAISSLNKTLKDPKTLRE